jgi:hypothetical protein
VNRDFLPAIGPAFQGSPHEFHVLRAGGFVPSTPDRKSSLDGAIDISAMHPPQPVKRIVAGNVEHVLPAVLSRQFTGQLRNVTGPRAKSINLRAPHFQGAAKLQEAGPENLRCWERRKGTNRKNTPQK